MEFLMSYWWLIIVIIAAIVVGVYYLYKFAILPSSEQMAKIKEWLLYAVTEAEKELGSGTGQIKLRYVYDMFIKQFPIISKILSFDVFSDAVDEVLETFRELLANSENLQAYVGDETS